MRVVDTPDALCAAVRTARSEAGSAFGDTVVYLERRLRGPGTSRSSCSATHHGTVVPFVERECSIQRRHQKVVEESPSLAVTPALRDRIAAAAAAVARAVGYTNAGTIEFLLDEDGSFYFLEMNTRLQVEHPVTEMVDRMSISCTGRFASRVANGSTSILRRRSRPRGHAIECRIYAEDPDQGFMPSPGLIRGLRPPPVPGVRDDGGVTAGYTVPVFYDSLIAKLIAWAPLAARRDRAHGACARRIPGARDQDDDPVLSLADAPAGLPRAGGTTRRFSIACSPTVEGRASAEFARRRRTADCDSRRARRVPANERGAGRRPAAAPRSLDADWRGARRCGDDVRGRGRGPDANGLGRADRPCRPVPRQRGRAAARASTPGGRGEYLCWS